MTAIDRPVAEVSSGLALAISVERVLHEAARQLRLAASSDAVAIALSGADPESMRLAYHSGFVREASEVEAALRPLWHDAVASGEVRVCRRSTPDGIEFTVGVLGESTRGALTAVADAGLSAGQLAAVELEVRAVAVQLATALDRADGVRRLVQKRRLEAIGEISAGVAHELRNPLFGISSAAQLLRFRVREDPVVEKNVGRILREVERLNAMAAALLEYGRVAPLRLAVGDPDELWEVVIAAQRGPLESRAVAVRHTPAEPRAAVSFDAEQLAQVFTSALVNAIEAAPEGTDITLVGTTLPGGSWRCRLHNEGSAVPADVLPRVFDLFFSTKPGHSGIGLPLCQRVIDAHGGSIAFENADNGGVNLAMSLPPAA